MFHREGDPKTAKFVFVGEAPAKNEERLGRPFIGLAGKVFDQCLSDAGIIRSQCFITNVFDHPVKKHKQTGNIVTDSGQVLFQVRGARYHEIAQPYLDRLETELAEIENPDSLIIPLGTPAVKAVCDKHSIIAWRGSIIQATRSPITGRKCVPTIHPANALHGSSINKFIISADFKRAKEQQAFPDIRRPKYDFKLSPTYNDCIGFLENLLKLATEAEKPLPVSIDIEVSKRQASRIVFSLANRHGFSVPFGDGNWKLEQEIELWCATAMILESPDVLKIFQNGMFDIQFLFGIHNILTVPPYDDTMVMQSIMYPEFSASLAYLTSIYTEQPYYKDMVKHDEIDKESG